MSFTSTAVAYIIGRMVLQRYKEHLETQNWPYAGVQKELSRSVARVNRRNLQDRPIKPVDHEQYTGLPRSIGPIVRIAQKSPA